MRFLLCTLLYSCFVRQAVQFEGGECTSDHVQQAVATISECKPREVVIQLPWPNNTDIQQVWQLGSYSTLLQSKNFV